MYADYTYYTDTFYGNIVEETDFPRYATKASDFIDYITYGKAADKADLDAVKKCCCALAEQYVAIESARARVASEGGEIQSETVGSHSRTFRSGTEIAQAARAELGNIARQYLLPTGLLYRGGVGCVCSAHCNSL